MLNDKTKEAVKNFIAKLGIELPAKPVVKLEDVTLMDGTILTVDAMEVGSPAMFTGADGVAIPAEGAYEYEGGTIVCAAGVVTEIKPKEVEEGKQPEAPAAPSEEMAAILSRLDAVEKAYQSSLAAKTTLEAELAENKKGLVVALSAIEEFNTTAVAVSLEAQKSKKMTELEFSKMTEHQKYQLAKYGEIKY
jgi:hypothetical protein